MTPCPRCSGLLLPDEEDAGVKACLNCGERVYPPRVTASVPVGMKKVVGTFVRERRNR